MSASAGKVMPRPMGEYNSATEYKVLDIVTYNDKPYMAKRTTTNNLPTDTTNWMLLLDFPTEVDNVPTENSQNLVYSGGVYGATADKMKVDGSNANNVMYPIPATPLGVFVADSLTKDAGANQTITIARTESTLAHNDATEAYLSARVGTTMYYQQSSSYIAFVVDTVTRNANAFTITAHLVEDNTEALNITQPLLYADSSIIGANSDGTIDIGRNNAISSDCSAAIGSECVVSSDNSFANGERVIASGSDSHAEGKSTVASGNYSHAEGEGAKASGRASHASGTGTIAGYQHQFVTGSYNNNRSGNRFEIGNGTSSVRSNAFEIDSSGYMSQNNGADYYQFCSVNGVNGYNDNNGTFHPFTGYKELVNNSVVLSTSADTTVTFTDASITADSTIEPFTSVYTIAPKNCVATNGSCTVTIPKQSTAQTIKVKIRVS